MDAQKAALTEIVGASNVYDTPEILESYGKDESFVKPLRPAAVVKVKEVLEVRKLVKWANQTKTPLIPISSGAPHFRGDTVPSVPEAVIVDLSGMKQIKMINPLHRIAVIEPGVTYGELNAALAKEGMAMTTCLAPRANKSVIASILEVEPRLKPRTQYYYSEPLRAMGVVWGDGVWMFTGEGGGGPRDLDMRLEQGALMMGGNGPNQMDFNRLLTQSQGTMGIVSWAGVRLHYLPSIHKMYMAPTAKEEELVDFVYRILKLRFADQLMIVNGPYLASLLGETADQIAELKEILPAWIALVGIAGYTHLPELRVSAQEQDCAEIAQQFGLKFLPSVPGAKGPKVLETIMNPSREPYFKQRAKGAFQDIFFVTTLDKTPGYISSMYSLAEAAGYPTSDIGVYIQPQHMGTSVHCEFSLPYDPANPREAAQVKKLFTKASEELSKQGAFYARPYGEWARLQYQKDAAMTGVLKKLKGIFDPNDIMNPGKLFNY